MQEKLLKALPGHWSARDLDDWFARRHAKALLEAQVRGEMNMEVFTAVRAPFPGVLAIDSPQHTLQRACARMYLHVIARRSSAMGIRGLAHLLWLHQRRDRRALAEDSSR